MAEIYQPCRNGLHVCGESADGERPVTVANFPTRSAAAARALFEQARAEVACADGEPDDLIVDLMIGRDCDTDFPMTRQMLSRLESLAKGAS